MVLAQAQETALISRRRSRKERGERGTGCLAADPRGWAVVIVVSVSVFLVGAGSSGPSGEAPSAPLRIPVADGSLSEEIARTRRLLKEGDPAEGVRLLRRLLGRTVERVVEVEPGRYAAVEVVVRSLLGSLGPEAKRAFEETFGDLARDRERAWSSRGGRAQRDALARELPLTAAGRRALAAQAVERFEAADFEGACGKWTYLLSFGNRGKEPGLRQRIALARLLAGDREGFESVKRLLGATGGSSGAWGRLAAWKRKVERDSAERVLGAPRHRAVFDRQGFSPPPAPFKSGVVMWRTAPVFQTADEFSRAAGRTNGRYAVPFAGRVYTSQFEYFFEFDGESGKILYMGKVPFLAGGLYGWDPDVERSPQALVVSERYLIGTFIVRVEKSDSFMSFAITEPIPFRRLFVFFRSDRRPAWRSDAVPGLRELNITGEPLLRGDTLYVGGWVKEGFINSYVAAVDLPTGKVIWKRLICGSQVRTTMFGEMAVEPYGVSMAVRGDLLFVATHAGAIAALKRDDGRIRWITTYERISSPSVYRRTFFMVSPSRAVWADNPLLVTRKDLVAAPRDSSLLLRLSADTGKVIRKLNVRLSPRMPYLLGIREGVLYRAGRMGIDALSLDFRTSRLCRPGEIVGRPALTREGIYFCTVGGLQFYDFASRKIRPVFRWPKIAGLENAGNVFVGERGVYVAGNRRISAYGAPQGGAP